MSDSQEKPWSNNPNAPKIPCSLYQYEKANFAGILICSILYGKHKTPLAAHLSIHTHSICLAILGIVIMLFFHCMAALFNPDRHRGERCRT